MSKMYMRRISRKYSVWDTVIICRVTGNILCIEWLWCLQFLEIPSGDGEAHTCFVLLTVWTSLMTHHSDLSVDDVSADSAEFPDRASMMELRLQAQEDEITLLKSSLADALRRIRLHDQLLPLLKQQLIAGGWCAVNTSGLTGCWWTRWHWWWYRIYQRKVTHCCLWPYPVNPSAARVLNQVCCSDGCTSSRRLSSSSGVDGFRHTGARYWTHPSLCY